MKSQNFNRLYACFVLACFMALTYCAQDVLAQSAPPTVVDLLRQSVTTAIEGKKLEDAGSIGEALTKYEDAVRLDDKSLDEYNRLAIPFQSRHSIAYWLAGRCHFDIARMKMQLRRSTQEITFNLTRAQQALTATLTLDRIVANRSDYQYTTEAWKFVNFRAQINMMMGDLIGARKDYALVANTLNKGFRPAVEGLAYIDYLEGRSQNSTTPSGLKVPEKPKSILTQKEIVDLAFDFLKIIFKQYKEEIALAQKLSGFISK